MQVNKLDKKKLQEVRQRIREKAETNIPTPEEAKRLGWKLLYDPNGERVIGYVKKNKDIIFIDGTRVRNKNVEIDDPDDADEA